MIDKGIQFPQFRMLSNRKSYYKITDATHFQEIQLSGSRKNKFEFHATQYPEMLKIKDMLECLDGIYIEISPETWHEIDPTV